MAPRPRIATYPGGGIFVPAEDVDRLWRWGREHQANGWTDPGDDELVAELEWSVGLLMSRSGRPVSDMGSCSVSDEQGTSYLSLDEATERTGLSEKQVRRLCAEGGPFKVRDRSKWIDEATVARYIEEKKRGS